MALWNMDRCERHSPRSLSLVNSTKGMWQKKRYQPLIFEPVYLCWTVVNHTEAQLHTYITSSLGSISARIIVARPRSIISTAAGTATAL